MLEKAAHQHARIARKRSFRAVAVMHVEIDDRDALQAVHFQRMARRDGDIVEKAEAHRPRRLGVMPRRTHAAKRVVVAARDHGVRRGDGRARRPQCRLIRLRTHHRVRIDLRAPFERPPMLDEIDMRLRVHAREVGFIGERRLFALDQRVDAARDQLILDRLQAARAFGMPRPHVVEKAVRVGIEAGRHVFCAGRCDGPRVSCLFVIRATTCHAIDVKLPHRLFPLSRALAGAMPAGRRRLYCPDRPDALPHTVTTTHTMTFKFAPLDFPAAFKPRSTRILRLHRFPRLRSRHVSRRQCLCAVAAANRDAARAGVRRRNRAAALREQSERRRVHQRHGRALRLRFERIARAFQSRQLLDHRGEARDAFAVAFHQELARRISRASSNRSASTPA